jgi:hypothetical protein
MAAMRIPALLLGALLAFALAAPAAAQPITVTIGGERLTLESPPGFGDTAFLSSPRLQELAESLTSASNRVLLFSIPDIDLRRFMIGDKIDLRRYMMVATPRGLERVRVTEEQFRAFVSSSLRDLGPPAKDKDFLKYLQSQTPGRPVLLAELKQGPNLVSIMRGTRLPDEGGFFGFFPKVQYILTTTTLFLLRGKALQLAVYSVFESPEDAEWIAVVTERWIEELQRINK